MTNPSSGLSDFSSLPSPFAQPAVQYLPYFLTHSMTWQ
jgi:hypothetical protein